MKSYFALTIILILLISGCAKTGPSCAPPSIPLNDGCCLDVNQNNACDRTESSEEEKEAAPAAARYEPAEEVPGEDAESETREKPASPFAPAPTAAPVIGTVIGTRGEETRDTSEWETIRLYYHGSIERCGKTIQFVSASFSIEAEDSITLQIGAPRETIAEGDIGMVIESNGLNYVVESFNILTGTFEDKSYVSLKINCK